jgi:hypothetical protein
VPDSPNSGGGLLGEFRRQIGDTAYNYVQMDVVCDDQGATGALVEVLDSTLITYITGGTAAPLNIDLFSSEADTIEKLVTKIRTTAQYSASVASDGESQHASADLAIIPPKDFLRKKVQLKSRRWSDSELAEFLDKALVKLGRDIGETYNLSTVPSALKDLVFLLGSLGMYWDQINNATKRRGLDLRVEDFRTLHQTLLDEYDRSLKAYMSRQPASISVLTPEQLDDLGAGEVIVGTQIRRNWRTGRMTPSHAVGYPAAEQVFATFIGGAKIRLDWTRSHSSGFYRYELWRGTTDAVNNASEIALPLGSVPATGTKIAMLPDVERTLWIDGGTSPLPPGTYYYRLYVYNANGLWAASEVTSATVPV